MIRCLNVLRIVFYRMEDVYVYRVIYMIGMVIVYSNVKIKKSLMDFIHLFPSLQERREKLKKHEFDSQGEK